MRRQDISRIEIHPGEFVRTPVAQQFEYVQLDCFGDTPWHYALAAHTILKLLLSLKQQDTRSVLRDRGGKTGAPQTPAHYNEIVLLRHHASPHSAFSPPRSDSTSIPASGRMVGNSEMGNLAGSWRKIPDYTH
jgi:hypothetical protein